MSRALVIAHRGASAREVENSLAAFRAAATLGADAIELDIHATRDGVLIVHHDEVIAGRHLIPRLSGAEARALRLANGEPVPTLAEALAAAGARLRVFVEVKTLPPEFDARLFEALDRGPNPAGYAVHGFDHRIVRRLGLERPSLARGVLSSAYLIRPLAALADAGASTLWEERSMVDDSLAAALHDAKKQLITWTVDDPAEMRRVLEAGVDGLCTNHPELGREAVDARAA